MFSTAVDPAGLVRHVAIGPITANSAAATWHRWLDDPRFDPALPVLWDCRGQFIHASLAELRRLGELTIATRSERRSLGSRTAILVAHALTRAVVQEIPDAAEYAARIEVFTDEDAAYRWLGVARSDTTPADGPSASR